MNKKQAVYLSDKQNHGANGHNNRFEINTLLMALATLAIIAYGIYRAIGA